MPTSTSRQHGRCRVPSQAGSTAFVAAHDGRSSRAEYRHARPATTSEPQGETKDGHRAAR